MGKQSNAPMGNVVQIDEAMIQDHLGKVVRGTVEECQVTPSLAR